MTIFLQLILKLKKESRRSYPSSEFGMAENGTSRDFTSRVVGPRNPKLVRHDHEVDQKGIRHNLSTINPYWQILENSSNYFSKILIVREVTQTVFWETHPAWIIGSDEMSRYRSMPYHKSLKSSIG